MLSEAVRKQNVNVFGHEFEIYDEDRGFTPRKLSNLEWNKMATVKNHLIVALHAAFMHHLPFQLRPDDIWIIIAQGIATHITKNAEKLRKKFVDFDGKKEILVVDNSLTIGSDKNDWSNVLKQFDDGCRKLTNNNIVDLMTCDFSTTSAITRTASKCVLFKAMSEYINFTTQTRSGIPSITLVGSVEDWKKLQAKCQQLKEMDIGLGFWLKYLLPIIDKIVESSIRLSKKEKLTKQLSSFWDSIYHFDSMSGGSHISGWIAQLFPYDIDSNKNRLEYACMSPGDVPASYSRAPMKWQYFDKEIKCGMYGGIFGFAQQEKTGCIAPIIGWIIAGQQ